MGPGRPLSPSLPGVPAEPGGPCREEAGWRKPARKHGPTAALAEKPTAHSAWALIPRPHYGSLPQLGQEILWEEAVGRGRRGLRKVVQNPLPFFHPLPQTLLQRGEGPRKSR